jgi:ribosome-associated translation inhibitor RaiA
VGRNDENRPVPEIEVTVRGQLPGAADYARQRLSDALGYAPEPVLAARVRLTEHKGPASRRSILVQANVDLKGRPIRAQATGENVASAVDQLHDRVRRRLDKAARHWEARRGQQPKPEGWRHGNLPAQRSPFPSLPEDEREIVRHKTFSLAALSVAGAVAELESLDYDFHLFTELSTGQDSVVYRTEEGYGLAQLRPGPVASGEIRLTVSAHPAARLTLAEARDRLDLSGWPFLFFADAGTGRGSVLYHRYDGHYGLITAV